MTIYVLASSPEREAANSQRNNHGAATTWHAQPAITSISASSSRGTLAAEPDISTERLMAMVRDDTGAEPDRQVEALQRAGMLRLN